jgi:hypothetical protein
MPVRKAVRAMQYIWDVSCAYKYKITRNTPVHQKVCDQSGSGTIPISNSQAVQHCADSWQKMLSGQLASRPFDSREYLRNSHEERQEFARYYPKDFRFLYKDTDRGDKNACKPGCYPVTPLMVFYRNGGGNCVTAWTLGCPDVLLHTSQQPKVPWRSSIPITHPGYLSVL